MFDNILTLYTKMTGKQIPKALEPQYLAWSRRAILELENKLGWSFDNTSNVNVLGYSANGCDCDIDGETLGEAPEKIGEYRFFSFNDKQPFVMIDPFKKVNAVYLCRVEPEGPRIKTTNGDVVILKQIKDFTPRYFNQRFGKYLKACREMTACQEFCGQSCTNC